MEKGPSVKPDYNSDSQDEDDNDEEDDEDLNQDMYQERSNFKNGVVNTRSVHNLYRNGINTGPGSGGSSGFRIRIPTGVSIAQPAPKIYAKMGTNPNPNANLNSNFNQKPNFGSPASASGSGLNYGTRVLRGCEDTATGKREREPVVAEMVAAIKMLGDGFVRMEQMKMEMAREIETMRMEMEMKRTEMILESQQRIVEAFAKAVSEKSKKAKRMPEPES